MADWTIKDIIITLFGASGWAVGLIKFVMDLRDDRRKTRETDLKIEEMRLKIHEDQRKEREERGKIASILAPLITQINEEEYLSLFKDIKRSDGLDENGKPLTLKRIVQLRDYAGKLEDIGAPLLAGQFARSDIYNLFGEEILTCDEANFLWKDEDMHYWKVFKLLAKAMRDERAEAGKVIKQ